MKRVIAICLPLAVAVLAGCGGQAPAIEPTAEPAAPEPTPEPTAVPPTPLPPTETPEPGPPLVIEEGQTAADGCTIATLDTASWGPIESSYPTVETTSGSFHSYYLFHDNEDGFDFHVELWTTHGFGWTGQLGTFPIDCTGIGICANFSPDGVNYYRAKEGEVDIIALSRAGETASGEMVLTNLTLQPNPGTDAPGCYHIDEVSISVEE